jgi:hypothetical protein
LQSGVAVINTRLPGKIPRPNATNLLFLGSIKLKNSFMKRVLFLLSVITLTAFQCSDSEEPVMEGSYSGQFNRISTSAQHYPSNVTLKLTDGSFSGTSSVNYFPGICKGSYSVDGTKILFRDSCVWTANFDWSLILNGEFNYTLKGDSLILIKNYHDKGNYDIYKLTKLE